MSKNYLVVKLYHVVASSDDEAIANMAIDNLVREDAYDFSEKQPDFFLSYDYTLEYMRGFDPEPERYADVLKPGVTVEEPDKTVGSNELLNPVKPCDGSKPKMNI